MALKTLEGLKEINGVEVQRTQWRILEGDKFIQINEEDNMLSIKIQNGPIKEVGVNGAQIETLLHIFGHILQKLDRSKPDKWNSLALASNGRTIYYLEERTKGREERGVEGTSKA